MIIIPFALDGATPATYSEFIRRLREHLTAGRPTSQRIPVLRQAINVPAGERFVYVDLTNYNEVTIRVAIDVVNVYVVGYRSLASSGTQSFVFQNNAENPAPLGNLFPLTTPRELPFTGDYPQLQDRARPLNTGTDPESERRRNTPMREQISLGLVELDYAINQMDTYATQAFQTAQANRPPKEEKKYRNLQHLAQATAFIQIIQMVSEAARFPYIEMQVLESIETGISFIPDAHMLSEENNWSRLSVEIMGATRDRLRGSFAYPVQLQNAEVDSIHHAFVRNREIALLLHDGGNSGGYDQGYTDADNCIPGPSGSAGRGRGKKHRAAHE